MKGVAHILDQGQALHLIACRVGHISEIGAHRYISSFIGNFLHSSLLRFNCSGQSSPVKSLAEAVAMPITFVILVIVQNAYAALLTNAAAA